MELTSEQDMNSKIKYQCPTCKTECTSTEKAVSCTSCKKKYAFKEGILQFMKDKNTDTWDHYWKRVQVYDDVMDILRKIMNVQLHRYLVQKIHSSAITLEPGGGSAYVSAMMAQEGLTAYALDYAYAPLRLAKEQIKSKAVLVQGDLFNIPFAANSFDLTFNNSTMEHFKNPLDGLMEMARVTKRGGYVFVGVPFTYGPLSVYKLKKSSFKDAWDGTTYDRKGLKDLFSDAGLAIVDCRTFFGRCFVGVLGIKK